MEVPDWPGVLLVEGSLLAGDILRRVTRRSRLRDSFLRFCSGREADDFRFLSSRLQGGNDLTARHLECLNTLELKGV